MLLGKYKNKLDAKNRAVLPSKLRAATSSNMVLVKGYDKCLYLYTEEAWKEYAKLHVETKPDEDEEARLFKSVFYANSMPIEADKQGRIMLPPDFLKYASIKEEMINIGAVSRIEIWAKEIYEEIASDSENEIGKLIGNMKKYVKQDKKDE